MRIESLQSALACFPDIDGFWRQQNFADAEAEIRARLPQTWATEWNEVSIELLTQLARAQALKGNLIGAGATLGQSRHMLTEGKFGARVEVRWQLEQGRLLCLSKNPAKAHDAFVQAWNTANANGLVFFAIDAALMLSTVRPPKFQNEWLKNALDLAKNAPDLNSRMWLAHLYLLDGWHSFDFRRFEEALESFELGLKEEIQSHPGQNFSLRWSKARVLRALGKTAEALAEQEALLRLMLGYGGASGHVYLEIAECKQLLNEKEEAKQNFELAYTELSKDGWYSDNRSEELERMKYLYKKR